MNLSDLQAAGLAVKRLQSRNHHQLDRRLREVGTTLSQWDALRHIAHVPGASTHELAVLTFMTDQSFGALAIRLADQGLITRTPGRGRVVHHAISPAGRAVLDEADKIADDVLAAAFAPLSPQEQQTLRALLERALAA